MSGEIFLFILLFLSGLVIISLLKKLDRVKKSFSNRAMDLIESNWDEDYKRLIAGYGTTDNFIKSHYSDFDIIRSNMLVFVNRIKCLSKGINLIFSAVSTDLANSPEVSKKLEDLKRATVKTVDNIVDDMVGFLENEEAAHSESMKINEVLDKLSKEVKEINFYE